MRVRDVLILLKWRLSLAIAAAATAGYALHSAAGRAKAALLFSGMLFLASGAGCLNNWQDRMFDRDLERTRGRPLPAGRIAAGKALALAAILMAAGLTTLATGPFPWSAFATAAFAVICYNALYTPLKTRTLFAMAPGILCGALPPLIGWLAAGGRATAVPVWGFVTVFGLWQPPHFWLIVLRHYGDYPRGGRPSLLTIFSRQQIVRILFVWTLALSMALLTLPLTAGVLSPFLVGTQLVNAALLTGVFSYHLFRRSAGPDYRLLFTWINAAVFAGVVLTIFSREARGL